MIYVAGITGESQYVKSIRAFHEIILRPGDDKQERTSGRGDVGRSLTCEEFLDGKWDAVALFDLDMLHPPDILERLRAHDVDMVSGHYYARNARNVHSLACAVGDGRWPYPPLLDIPRSGLHRIGMMGMGCVLIKRAVVEAVQKRLPPGDNAFGIGPCPEITGDHRSLGSDFRFFSLAQMLGYKLYLDADVESRHAVVFWLNHELADGLRGVSDSRERTEAISDVFFEERGVDAESLKLRIASLEKRLEEVLRQQEAAETAATNYERQALGLRSVISDEKWLLQQELPPPGAFPEVPESERQLVLDNRKGVLGASHQEAAQARDTVLQKEAKGFVDDIQTIRGQVPGDPGEVRPGGGKS